MFIKFFQSRIPLFIFCFYFSFYIYIYKKEQHMLSLTLLFLGQKIEKEKEKKLFLDGYVLNNVQLFVRVYLLIPHRNSCYIVLVTHGASAL